MPEITTPVRQMKRLCENCRYWNLPTKECRGALPFPAAHYAAQAWPRTSATAWCGQHEFADPGDGWRE